jgi:hypothetical protein
VPSSSWLHHSEEETTKAKRLQNTLAARRSRKRKLEYQCELEDAIKAERKGYPMPSRPSRSHSRRWQHPSRTFVSMNITSTITTNSDRPMIPSEASAKRKASGDNSLNTNGALKSKRPRNDVSPLILSTLALLNVMEQISASNKRKRTRFVHVLSFVFNSRFD